MDDALGWIKSGGRVAIFDATNTTRERRKIVFDKIVYKNGLKCMFLGMIFKNIKYRTPITVSEHSDYIFG